MKSMNRWVLFAIVVIVAVVLDISTKTWAEHNLASQSSSWVHGLQKTVTPDDYGLLAKDYVIQNWHIDMEDENEARAINWLFAVDPAQPDRETHLQPYTILDERVEHVELRYRSITVIDGFWTFSYAENTGAAFGFLAGQQGWLRRGFFILVSIVALGLIYSLYRRVPDDKRLLQFALAAVVGGAIGNLIDRLRYGYVVDFIDWYATIGGQVKHWPTFNIADVFVSCGVTLLIVLIVFGYADFEDAPHVDHSDKSQTPAA